MGEVVRMKWFCLSAGVLSLGLGVGFWAGKSQVVEGQQEEEHLQRGARTERSVSVRRRSGGDERRARTRSQRATRMIDKMQYWGVSEISKARLMKEILELDASEFPEVLKKLSKIRLSGMSYSSLYDHDSGGDLVEVAVTRWYELEGFAVLDWVLSKPEVLGDREFLGDLLTDGYERDPEGSFAYLREHAGMLSINDGLLPDSLVYEIGRWSRNFEDDYIELLRLETEFGLRFYPSDNSIFSVLNFPLKAMMKGMLNAGREVELREVLARLDASQLVTVDDLLEDQKVAEIESEGWLSVKAAMDSGDIKVNFWDASKVLDQWAKEDPEAAVVWYLGLEEENGYLRGEQIQAVVSSEIFQEKTSDGKQLQVEEVVEFLGEMESAGEPVVAGWTIVVDDLVNDERWDDLERILPQAPQDILNHAMKEVRDFAVNSESLSYSSISNSGREILDRFGMLEKVESEIDLENGVRLRALAEVLRQ